MAVTRVDIVHDGWSATQDSKYKVEFTVVYRVEVDDRADGPQTIATADDGTTAVPRLREEYKVGNDHDRGSMCKSVAPRPLGGLLWEVTCVFGPLSIGDEKAGAGHPRDQQNRHTQNWEDVTATVAFFMVRTSKAATEGVYKGQLLKHRGQDIVWDDIEWDFGPVVQDFAEPQMQLGHFGFANGVSITNSCWVPFDPPPEKDYSRVGVRITRNHLHFPTWDMLWFVDTVNSAGFLIDMNNARMWVPAFAAKMQSVTGDNHLLNGRAYWQVQYEFHIDVHFGWAAEILDRGLHRAGNRDDAGNQQSMAQAKNRAPIEAIEDAKGHPITEPVKLDGHGQVLKPDRADGLEAVWLRYALYPEISWAELNLNQIHPFI